MPDLARLWLTTGWERLAFDAAWQSTLLALAAWGFLRFCPLRPATRAALALCAVLLCVTVPLASTAARYNGWGLLAARPTANSAPVAIASPAPPQVGLHPALGSTVPANRQENKVNLADRSPRAGALPTTISAWAWRSFAAGWLLATTVLTIRLARSALAVRRASRAAIPCQDDELQAELLRAAATLDLPAPELCISQAIDSPALVTWEGPRLLLPFGPLPQCDWFAVFCHELAHLARRDGASRLAVELVAVALPWQPLVWLLRREFRAACEEACDDWAIAAGADPVEFAAILVDFIPQARPVFVLGMSESVPAARHRVLRLLGMQGTPRPRLGRALGAVGWVVAIALTTALALLQFRSRPEVLPPWGNQPASIAAAKAPHANQRPTLSPYRVEAPDVLLIDAVKVVPKPPYHLEPLDTVNLNCLGTLVDQPITGPHAVEADGTIALGAAYGAVKIGGLTLAEAKEAITRHLQALLTEPEISISLAETAGVQQISGEHLIAPDGTVNLGVYGSVYVSGMTLAEVRAAVEKHLAEFLDQPKISADVFAYNSKVYYVVAERDGGDMIQRIPITGNETVLDGLTQISGLKLSPDSWVWVSRIAPGAPGATEPQILPVDWKALFRGESNATNYWLQPGDRIFVCER